MDWIFTNLTSIFIILTTITLLIKYIQTRKNYHKLPPGPWWKFPLFGHLPVLGKHPHKTFYEMRKSYGDIFMLQIGSWPSVILNSRTIIHEAFVKNFETFAGRPQFFTSTHPAVSRSLAFGKYDKGWKLQRKIANNVLRTHANIKDNQIEELVQGEALNLSIDLIGSETGCPQDLIHLRVGSIIYQICYGRMGDCVNDDSFKMLVYQNELLASSLSAGNLIDAVPWMRFLMPKKVEEFIRVIEDSDIFQTQLVENHLKMFDSNNIKDLTDGFILSVKKLTKDKHTANIDVNRIYASLQTIVGAGFDTTSSVIEWLVLYMALYPDEQRKIQRDIDEVIGQRKVTFSDRQNMPYTFATILEILRLRTLLPLGLPHATIKDTTLGGYCIPAGTVVIANLYAVSRDESVWENPDEFKPSRFIKENGEIDNEKAEYKLSFGAGRRRCMGEFFAKEALFLIFTTILQQCRIERIPGIKYDLEGKLGISLRPSEYKVKIFRRKL